MERPLYRLRSRVALDSAPAGSGADADEMDVSTLFEQVHVDPEPLRTGVRDALRTRPQVELTEVIASRPLEHGLAELVTYLSLTDAAFEVLFDEDHRDEVLWLDADGVGRRASIPRVVFTRTAEVGRSLA